MNQFFTCFYLIVCIINKTSKMTLLFALLLNSLCFGWTARSSRTLTFFLLVVFQRNSSGFRTWTCLLLSFACRKLEKGLHRDPQPDLKLKYLTGEWFYEVKSRRHTDKIHGSEIILASMKQGKAAGLGAAMLCIFNLVKNVALFVTLQLVCERFSFFALMDILFLKQLRV